MASLMPPPPSRPPKVSSTDSPTEGNQPERSDDGLMPPPPPRQPAKPSNPNETASSSEEETAATQSQCDASSSEPSKEAPEAKNEEPTKKNGDTRGRPHINSSFNDSIYTKPPWSAAPAFPFSLEVIKDGASVGTFDVSKKGAYMFGRSDQCDFMLEHPSISRFHAVLQFKRPSEVFIYDLGSTHGTVVNKKKVVGKTYTPLHVGDLLKFGLSSRLYVLQGPDDLMPKEVPGKAERHLLREVQNAIEMADKDESLLRARREAMQMEGATWGMMEDAFEDETQEEEEITWQTYKGQLTEKQQKTLEKIHKRNEKIAALKREIDAIQVKEIPQGGLTQGQQTQVARNQQRIEQLMEELDNLEETLNQSIQESMGARGLIKSSRKGEEEEEEDASDEDEFYDRTKHGKAKGSTKGGEAAQVVETAVSLLEKKEKIMKDIERLFELIESEEKNNPGGPPEHESQDALDAFMTDVSSKLESDRVLGLRKEIEREKTELERIKYLLKIADPSGEEERKWEKLKLETPMQVSTHKEAVKESEKPGSINVSEHGSATPQEDKRTREKKETKLEDEGTTECSKANITVQAGDELQDKKKSEGSKGPLWLGHARKIVTDDTTISVNPEKPSEDGEFLEYKERHKAAKPKEIEEENVSCISEDTPGLILRKPKSAAKKDTDDDDQQDEKSLMEGAALAAADTVALLMRHQRGLGAIEQEFQEEEKEHSMKEDLSATKRRKLGPEKPDFMKKEDTKFQAWIPPSGQTGDGRTSLNDKYGY